MFIATRFRRRTLPNLRTLPPRTLRALLHLFLIENVYDGADHIEIDRAKRAMVSQDRRRAHPRFWLVLFVTTMIAIIIYLIWQWNALQWLVAGASVSISEEYEKQREDNNVYGSYPPGPDLSWYAPSKSFINDLSTMANSNNAYGFIYNSSTTPSDLSYATYNWCNMPHVRATEYQSPGPDFELSYVEVIHRHHKRTPYQANTFPVENYPWKCDDIQLYYYGAPDADGIVAQIAWSIAQANINPFTPEGFPNSTCQFPQITAEGLYDSRQHGRDLFSVYHDMLHFLPDMFDSAKIEFHVTTNVITSQVAGQVAVGMYPALSSTQLRVSVQPAGVDSLEPQYPCPGADDLQAFYGIGSDNPEWLTHLVHPSTTTLFEQLDAISGINTSDPAWHNWFDHYYDNLSARLCHGKPLPCNTSNPALCVSEAQANAVFRRGLYEYSYLYRDNPLSLQVSTAAFGVWIAQLAHNLRVAMSSTTTANSNSNDSSDSVIYRHNVAHDGSIAHLLSILQLDVMVWPGMGSEVVFELWRQRQQTPVPSSEDGHAWFLRVLWKGQPLRSSSPALGLLDMVPVQRFLAYVDGLVGVDAAKVPGLCAAHEYVKV